MQSTPTSHPYGVLTEHHIFSDEEFFSTPNWDAPSQPEPSTSKIKQMNNFTPAKRCEKSSLVLRHKSGHTSRPGAKYLKKLEDKVNYDWRKNAATMHLQNKAMKVTVVLHAETVTIDYVHKQAHLVELEGGKVQQLNAIRRGTIVKQCIRYLGTKTKTGH